MGAQGELSGWQPLKLQILPKPAAYGSESWRIQLWSTISCRFEDMATRSIWWLFASISSQWDNEEWWNEVLRRDHIGMIPWILIEWVEQGWKITWLRHKREWLQKVKGFCLIFSSWSILVLIKYTVRDTRLDSISFGGMGGPGIKLRTSCLPRRCWATELYRQP